MGDEFIVEEEEEEREVKEEKGEVEDEGIAEGGVEEREWECEEREEGGRARTFTSIVTSALPSEAGMARNFYFKNDKKLEKIWK